MIIKAAIHTRAEYAVKAGTPTRILCQAASGNRTTALQPLYVCCFWRYSPETTHLIGMGSSAAGYVGYIRREFGMVKVSMTDIS
jgi:hypothetical protein